MATSKTTTASEFPVSLKEFAGTISRSQIESRSGFEAAIKKLGLGKKKVPSEWKKLYELYRTRPMRVSLDEWMKKED